MPSRVDDHADGFACAYRPRGQIRGKVKIFSVVARAYRHRGCRVLRGDCPQVESDVAPRQYADQRRAQEDAKAVSNGVRQNSKVGFGVQALYDFRKNSGAALLFSRTLRKTHRL